MRKAILSLTLFVLVLLAGAYMATLRDTQSSIAATLTEDDSSLSLLTLDDGALSRTSPVTDPAGIVPVPFLNTPETASSGVQHVEQQPAASLSTVDVVKLLSPSIVRIESEILVRSYFNRYIPSTSVGTGIILDEQGYILTNHHVIEGAQAVTVILSNGDSYSATVIGSDPSIDIAVVQVEAEGLRPATLGDSDALQVGEDVIAFGHALGLSGGPTVSKGIVSALERSISLDAQTVVDGLVQTDAAINPGNSGGALVNTYGEVIAVNTAIIQDSEGIGFAVSIDDAKAVIEGLIGVETLVESGGRVA